ncbi:MAG: cupin-like domain-containing protein [Myxococcota bacterium]
MNRTKTTIPRLPPMTKRQFYRTLRGIRDPFIICDDVETWPAWSKWSFDWLREQHGDIEVPVEWLRYSRRPGQSAIRVGRVKNMTLAEYVDSLSSDEPGDKGYVIGPDILKRIPALLGDIRFPNYHDHERLVERIAFIGDAGTYTQLHYDRAHNLHAVFTGRKRWQLYAPNRGRQLRPVNLSFVWSIVSELDLAPEGGRFEDVSGDAEALPGGVAPDFDIVLEAGEMLFLPYGWWHRVITLEPSIAVNYWWWPLDLVARRAPFILPSLVFSRIQERLRPPVRRGYYG